MPATHLYESHYVTHFFRLWGYEEGKAGTPIQSQLLGNMQNAFDSDFGDVCAQVGARLFIIEFKADRNSFAREVAPSGKHHRAALYQHLRNDPRCRRLAQFGHFGGYYDAHKGALLFEPYPWCPAPQTSRADIIVQVLGNAGPTHEMTYGAAQRTFQEFYVDATEPDDAIPPHLDGFYGKGLGLTVENFEAYVRCMYAHLVHVADDEGHVVLCSYVPKQGRFVAFSGTPASLIATLFAYFDRAARQLTDPSAPHTRGPGVADKE